LLPFVGKWLSPKEAQTTAIPYGPVVEITGPALHLTARHLGWIFNETGQRARLMHARRPELLSQKVILANVSCKSLQVRTGNSVDLLGMDSEASYAGNAI